jgi:DNA/RNA-binding domain of Phe-tRNA-synthetase-like protein
MARHRLLERARSRLALCNEGGMPEIQAWRRAFSEMGLKPTQYRCAAEALLRRLRTEADLPRVHPLIDVCNAASAAYAIPIAVFDTARMASLEVRPAAGTEVFETFSGDIEHPEPGEIVFVDEAGRAHARRWTHRQSRRSAVSADTQSVLVVAEALHPDAASDLKALGQSLRDAITEGWPHAQIVEESRC